jgi:hypothetical protein
MGVLKQLTHKAHILTTRYRSCHRRADPSTPLVRRNRAFRSVCTVDPTWQLLKRSCPRV